MGNAQRCPEGTEIEELAQCKDAETWGPEMGIVSWYKNSVSSSSWSSLPPQCSYQSDGKLHFHFNTQATGDVSSFSNGMYQMICKKGNVFLK